MRPGGVRLVPAQRIRGGAGPSRPDPRDPQLAEKAWQGRGIASLPRGEDQNQRQAAAVDQGMGLGRETATGPTDGVIVRFVPTQARILVIRWCPLCTRWRSAGTSRRSRRAEVAPGVRPQHEFMPVVSKPVRRWALQPGP